MDLTANSSDPVRKLALRPGISSRFQDTGEFLDVFTSQMGELLDCRHGMERADYMRPLQTTPTSGTLLLKGSSSSPIQSRMTHN